MPGCIYAVKSGKRLAATSDNGTMLERLESAGIAVEYQCREGYCGSCRVRLLDGEVEYLARPLAFVNPGEVLPCCCRPKGNVKLDV
ncbi:class I ribonucleotide reductase maintenance protein YfaE [Providencia sp. PROV255]|uniref:class I ribonucleotide reductase maintenance protein YfaE n=1 Tax=Providencia sp. PROV255 TaxID=2949943 RepID=UPI002349A244|nr:class I ribonucleotide reductase maintenance protein YfaE [Providencia sp. PROV255]